jgi:hypothetical protein
MCICALIPLPMAKEKEKLEIKLVDEEEESVFRYVRLHKDEVEEIEERPPLKLSDVAYSAHQYAASKEAMKTRSIEPDLGVLIEKESLVEEEPWEAQLHSRASFPWGWAVLAVCAFTGAILWSLFRVKEGEEKRQTLVNELVAIQDKDRNEEISAELQIDTLEVAVRNFFDSRSIEEMLEYVRHPERVRPLMEKHYAGKMPKAVRVESIIALDPLTIDKRASFWMISCRLAGGEKTQLLAEAVSDKEAKIDWETYVCYQPMAWDEFADSRPKGFTEDFRVYVERDNFYSHEFADYEKFDSYRLTALNGESVLFGYVPRGSELSRRILELFDQKPAWQAPMILKLHIPEDLASPRGVIIQDLVSPRWAFVDPP